MTHDEFLTALTLERFGTPVPEYHDWSRQISRYWPRPDVPPLRLDQVAENRRVLMDLPVTDADVVPRDADVADGRVRRTA